MHITACLCTSPARTKNLCVSASVLCCLYVCARVFIAAQGTLTHMVSVVAEAVAAAYMRMHSRCWTTRACQGFAAGVHMPVCAYTVHGGSCLVQLHKSRGGVLPADSPDCRRCCCCIDCFLAQAPEMLMHGRCSRASDVYAFGILLWEVATGGKAFAGRCLGHSAAPATQQC